MKKVYLFGGTTEGRTFAFRLAENGIGCIVRVASDYGAEAMGEVPPKIEVRSGRLDAKRMEAEFSKEQPSVVVDATHPFAQIVSGEIKRSCEACGLLYLRLLRGMEGAVQDAHYVCDMEEAAAYCDAAEGNILLTTGSKEIAVFVGNLQDPSRVYARVLPDEASIRALKEAGMASSHIIAMQGPFSVQMNEATLAMTKASLLVTKASGEGSGFLEKMEAAKRAGVQVVVIGAPKQPDDEEAGLDAEHVFMKVCAHLGISNPAAEEEAPRELLLAGAGPGAPELLTREVKDALHSADVIFGAERLLEGVRKVPGKDYLPYFQKDEILRCLDAHPEYKHPVVLFSGDTTLFSGARHFVREGDEKYRFRMLPGISSVSFFAARLRVPLQDAAIVSMHGRRLNLIAALQRSERVFVLTEGAAQCREIGERIVRAESAGLLSRRTIQTGYRLSYPDEQIETHTAATLRTITRDGLYVLYITGAGDSPMPLAAGIPDASFVRGKVPMTKAEIRAQILRLLQITPHMVLFDVGAGTGSVSVEAARLCPEAKVFSFERDAEGIRLIRENAAKFFAEKITVVEGEAPDTFLEVPEVATHAFIGGSGKRMRDILSALLKANPSMRIVISAVTIETLTESVTLLRELTGESADVTQIAVTRAAQTGAYHMMRPLTPVWLISTKGKGDGGENV